jgi:hypothetical protein
MKKVLLVMLLIPAVSALVTAQNWSSPVDILGAHNNQGRGCAGCHAPHSGSFGAGEGGATDAGSYALWGQDASPLYGKTVLFGDHGEYVVVLPNGISTGGKDVTGILMCLSCHDGNLTKSNMMQNWSYEQQIGLLTNTTYGKQKIPTLLGSDGTTGGNYYNDHPVGQNATIPDLSGYGLVWANNSYTITPGSAYDMFVTNYGWPALAPGKWSNPWGINNGGQPYVVCTTCHNQHDMTVYASTFLSQIQKDGGGKFYATYFFINGPYNPNIQGYASTQAPSTAQFCRECHFTGSNEAHNTNNISTAFQ